MEVYIGKRRIRLHPAASIGKGGEADVFDIGSVALKVFKSPGHPDFHRMPDAQRAARERISFHQQKLPALAQLRGMLPPNIMTPLEMAYERPGGRIIGYTIPLLAGGEVLLRYADRTFREMGVGNDEVRRVFRDLHGTVRAAHQAGVVIGDLNDLNVLVCDGRAYLIDADSFQFGAYPCTMFTARFVDPRHCDPNASSLALVSPHTEDSDWYAFTVMLMQSLLFVAPYGGVYRPKVAANRVPHDLRPLRRITIFHPEVQYPRAAVLLTVLPDNLLQYFRGVFERDERGPFPLVLLDALCWKRCTACGTEHARMVCPLCMHDGIVLETVRIRGTVRATRLFATKGVILVAGYQSGRMMFLYHEDGRFRREDGAVVLRGLLDPRMRLRIGGQATLIGRGNDLAILRPGDAPEPRTVDACGGVSMFDGNGSHTYWVEDGRLMRDGRFGPVRIGDVLRGQTRFWVGEAFGFGLYRAGDVSVAFVFNAETPGINDAVPLPVIRGRLVDAMCVFSNDRAWVTVETEEAGRRVHQCFVITRNGACEAQMYAVAGEASWLGTLRGACAVDDFLFAPTDDGVIRIEIQGGVLTKTREFPDSRPFVNQGTRLFADRKGLYAVSRQDVTLLEIA